MSVFTFIGNNLLQRDDLFSFKIISEAIKTILPAIFVHVLALFMSSSFLYDFFNRILMIPKNQSSQY